MLDFGQYAIGGDYVKLGWSSKELASNMNMNAHGGSV